MTLTLRRNWLPLFLFFVACLLFYARPAHAQAGLCKAGVQCRAAGSDLRPAFIATTGATSSASSFPQICMTSQISARGWAFGVNATNSFGLGFTGAASCPTTVNSTQWDNSGNLVQPGYLQASAGSAAAPTFNFTGDATTGIFRNGTGQIGFAGSGVLNGAVGPNGLFLTGAADMSAFAAASGVARDFEPDQTLNHFWYSDGFMWRDVQSGAHPVLDSTTWAVKVGLESAACPLIIQNVPDSAGTASAVSCVQNATALTFADGHDYRRQQSTASTGNQATFITTNPITEARLLPRVCALVYTGSATNQRFYVGVGSALPTANVGAANATAVLAASSAVIRWSAANDSARWVLATSDGSTTSTTTFGANGGTVTAAHSYRVCVDLRGNTKVTGYVQDLTTGLESRVVKLTNLPVAATQLKPFIVAESESNAVADLGVAAMSVETN